MFLLIFVFSISFDVYTRNPRNTYDAEKIKKASDNYCCEWSTMCRNGINGRIHTHDLFFIFSSFLQMSTYDLHLSQVGLPFRQIMPQASRPLSDRYSLHPGQYPLT